MGSKGSRSRAVGGGSGGGSSGAGDWNGSQATHSNNETTLNTDQTTPDSSQTTQNSHQTSQNSHQTTHTQGSSDGGSHGIHTQNRIASATSTIAHLSSSFRSGDHTQRRASGKKSGATSPEGPSTKQSRRRSSSSRFHFYHHSSSQSPSHSHPRWGSSHNAAATGPNNNSPSIATSDSLRPSGSESARENSGSNPDLFASAHSSLHVGQISGDKSETATIVTGADAAAFYSGSPDSDLDLNSPGDAQDYRSALDSDASSPGEEGTSWRNNGSRGERIASLSESSTAKSPISSASPSASSATGGTRAASSPPLMAQMMLRNSLTLSKNGVYELGSSSPKSSSKSSSPKSSSPKSSSPKSSSLKSSLLKSSSSEASTPRLASSKVSTDYASSVQMSPAGQTGGTGNGSMPSSSASSTPQPAHHVASAAFPQSEEHFACALSHPSDASFSRHFHASSAAQQSPASSAFSQQDSAGSPSSRNPSASSSSGSPFASTPLHKPSVSPSPQDSMPSSMTCVPSARPHKDSLFGRDGEAAFALGRDCKDSTSTATVSTHAPLSASDGSELYDSACALTGVYPGMPAERISGVRGPTRDAMHPTDPECVSPSPLNACGECFASAVHAASSGSNDLVHHSGRSGRRDQTDRPAFPGRHGKSDHAHQPYTHQPHSHHPHTNHPHTHHPQTHHPHNQHPHTQHPHSQYPRNANPYQADNPHYSSSAPSAPPQTSHSPSPAAQSSPSAPPLALSSSTSGGLQRLTSPVTGMPRESIDRDKFVTEWSGGFLDHYDLSSNEKLGQGTYGYVCKGRNKQTGQLRAIKTISKSHVKNMQRFRLEVDIMKSLDHPNIIKLFETFEDHHSIYLAMEICEGGELFDRIIEQGHFTEKDAAILMKQIFSAVHYLHSISVMHRDLKPENFLFLAKSRDSPLKIIDFGLSCRFAVGQFVTTKAGTVLQGRYNQACDFWSAGVIMFILLCGYPPFYGETDAEVLAKVRAGNFVFSGSEWRKISDDAKDLIRKLLRIDPARRYTAEEALQHPWIKNLAQHSSNVELPSSIMSNLKFFRAQNKLKKAALTIIAKHMSEKDIEGLRKIFMKLDVDNSGTLSLQEVREGLKEMGWTEIPPDLQQIMEEVDSDGSGFIDYTEFIAATMDCHLYMKEDVCWTAFRVFDLDGNGKISEDELRRVLGNKDVEDLWGREKIEALLSEVDLNGDGEIDFEEFMVMMRKTRGSDRDALGDIRSGPDRDNCLATPDSLLFG